MKGLLLTAVVALTLSVAYGLKCYTCEGGDSVVAEGACGDTFDKDANKAMLMMCNATAGEIYCRKQKTGINHAYTNTERGCAKMCEEKNVVFIDRITCCEGDGCNGAGEVRVWGMMVALPALLMAVL